MLEDDKLQIICGIGTINLRAWNAVSTLRVTAASVALGRDFADNNELVCSIPLPLKLKNSTRQKECHGDDSLVLLTCLAPLNSADAEKIVLETFIELADPHFNNGQKLENMMLSFIELLPKRPANHKSDKDSFATNSKCKRLTELMFQHVIRENIFL